MSGGFYELYALVPYYIFFKCRSLPTKSFHITFNNNKINLIHESTSINEGCLKNLAYNFDLALKRSLKLGSRKI